MQGSNKTIRKSGRADGAQPRIVGIECELITVEPLLSGQPLSGQLLKSQSYCQYNTVNKAPFKRPPLLSDRVHLSAVP